MTPRYVKTGNQNADFLTKASFSSIQWAHLCKSVGLYPKFPMAEPKVNLAISIGDNDSSLRSGGVSDPLSVEAVPASQLCDQRKSEFNLSSNAMWVPGSSSGHTNQSERGGDVLPVGCSSPKQDSAVSIPSNGQELKVPLWSRKPRNQPLGIQNPGSIIEDKRESGKNPVNSSGNISGRDSNSVVNGSSTPLASKSYRAAKRARYKANRRQIEATIYDDYDHLANWNNQSNKEDNLSQKSNTKFKNKRFQDAAPGLAPQWEASFYQ